MKQVGMGDFHGMISENEIDWRKRFKGWHPNNSTEILNFHYFTKDEWNMLAFNVRFVIWTRNSASIRQLWETALQHLLKRPTKALRWTSINAVSGHFKGPICSMRFTHGAQQEPMSFGSTNGSFHQHGPGAEHLQAGATLTRAEFFCRA